MSIADSRVSTNGWRGQFVVLTMFAMGIAAATFAWWWNYNRGRNALEFYGAEAATLIRSARTVEILVPPSSDDDRPSGSDESRASPSTRQIDISRVPGLLNARTSLLDDASYEWNRPTTTASSDAAVVIRFVENQKQVVLRFDFDARSVSIIPDGRQATLVKKTAEGWRSFISRNSREGQAAQRP